jgi:hypothetical protein
VTEQAGSFNRACRELVGHRRGESTGDGVRALRECSSLSKRVIIECVRRQAGAVPVSVRRWALSC